MSNIPILSLCIPTNGMVEWVLPVLDSIYQSEENESLFEVVVEDNGEGNELEERLRILQATHSNIRYFHSSAQGFLCQVDCFKHARGTFVKFVNHRSRFVPGALAYLLSFAKENESSRPVVFFSNGSVAGAECEDFDAFVAHLSYYSSWSGGLAFWREDLDRVLQCNKLNATYPHTDVLFSIRDAARYVVDDTALFSDIDAGHGAKGRYNLFRAFALEFPAIICDLLRENSICIDTYLSVKDNLLTLLADFYIDFIILRHEASYSFDDYEKYIRASYSKTQFQRRLCLRFGRKIGGKIAGPLMGQLNGVRAKHDTAQ